MARPVRSKSRSQVSDRPIYSQGEYDLRILELVYPCYYQASTGGPLMPVGRTNRRMFITALGGALSMFLGFCAAAQEGHHGIGHEKWHRDFYAKLKRTDGTGSCCSDGDCRPTVSR